MSLFDETRDYESQREAFADAADLARKQERENGPRVELEPRRLKPGTQCSRILAVLWDCKPHSLAEIHRRAGHAIVHSRIAELRAMGCTIEQTRRPHRTGASASVYRLVETPATIAMPREHDEWARSQSEAQDRRSEIPRDEMHRFRLYGVRDGDVLDILGTARDEEGIGVLLCSLGRKGDLRGVCVGVLDTRGTETRAGTWLVNPWEEGSR